MSVDPRAPVIVGADQLSWREADVPPPLELMTRAARGAAEDAGAAGAALLERAQAVAVVESFSWPAPDPGAALAVELRIGGSPESLVSARGGNGPIALLAELAERIQAGGLDVALLAGGEAMTPFMRAVRSGGQTGWLTAGDGDGDGGGARVVGEDHPASHPAEEAAGLIAPIFYYPLFENALRASTGGAPDPHRERIARLWARFAAVAAENPYAWTRDAPDAEAIATPGPENRMVSFPYPKLMNANIQVDQAAALLLCSAGAAEAAGIPSDRWVFVHATAAAHDHWHVGTRERLDRSPALVACGAAALGHAGVGIDDVAHLDIYSCFPSAVQVAGRALGVDVEGDPRPPTVTGGLTFAGGPANDYVTHALATLAGRVREDPGALGLSTGVGWYLTKHGVALLGTRPPARPYAHHAPQAEVDALPARAVAEGWAGTAPVETYTALYDRDGTPTLGIVSLLLEDGRRAFARTEERAVVGELLDGDALGRPARVDGAALVGFGTA